MSDRARSILRDILVLFFVALAIRVALVIYLPSNDSVFWDQPYMVYARNFAEGRGFWMPNPYSENVGPDRVYAFRPPLFPFLWGCVYKATGGSYLPVRMAFAIFGSITVALAYLIGIELTGRRLTAFLAGLICAGYPPLVWHSIHLMTEPMFILLQTTCIYALLRLRGSGKSGWLLLAGIAAGLGILTRSVLIGFMPVAALWMLWSGSWKRRAWVNAVVFGGIVCIVMSPWIIRNYRVFHRLVVTTTDAGHGAYVANNPNSLGDERGFWIPEDWGFVLKPGEQKLDEVEANRRLMGLARGYLIEHPGTAAKLMAQRFVTLWRFWPNPEFVARKYVVIYALSYVPLFPFIVAGIWLAHRRLRERLGALVLVDALLLYTTGIHVLLLAMMRYRVPLMPFLIVYAAFAMTCLVRPKAPQDAGSRLDGQSPRRSES
jgi:4-amino-4-deoxy-L-arabinose transferase-like glycosyltransferase